MGALVIDPASHSLTASAFQYADDVLSGRMPACRWVRLACERHKRDLERSESSDWPYRFNAAQAEKALKFVELMPHTKGKWAAQNERLVLEPWQRFFVASIFGWVHKATSLRRFREARLKVPRKNGKSALAAGIGNYMLTADGEFGAEVYSGATTQKQAFEVFKPARLMAKKTPMFCRAFGVTVAAQKLETATGGVFEPIVGDPGDGASPSCSIVDEYHEHKTDKLYDTMKTGMGAREQPLMLVITTAGDNIAGPCYLAFDELKNVLEGVIEDDELFGLIYTIDDGDEWTDPANLVKANPNFGVSVSADFLRSELAKAIRSPRNQARFKTKHLNIWIAARSAYFNMEDWRRQGNPGLIIPQGDDVARFGALDLSSKLDITASLSLWRKLIDGQHHYFVVAPHFYLPEETADNPENKHYAEWKDSGALTVTDGNIIDFEVIKGDIEDDHDAFPFERIGYDPWGATQLVQQIQDELHIEAVEYPQRVANLSEPMKWVEALLKAGRLHHDGNPVLTWMVSNVIAKPDANDNVFPRKPSNEKKIDGAVALIMALGLAMAEDQDKEGDMDSYFASL
ncbi:terminase TerL endonuclease subunit [uncultured Cohaesibacter sp.]|uniref:terminase large subunit n=1 Tax=uncultured Cohaesibacter sp. TaxID=1002546 RepID=UPI0029C76626|nr:terminase TerL endonuclease subunit [uncultured Cohaesibacter sp.]